MKNIVVLHLNMKMGGVESQLLHWINYIESKDRFVLLLCKKEGEFISKISTEIEIIEIGSYPKGNFDFIWFLKLLNIINKLNPKLIFSLHGCFNTYLAFIKNKKRKVYLSFPGYPIIGKAFFINRYLWKKADKIIPVSRGMEAVLREKWQIKNIHTIENTIKYCPVIKDIIKHEGLNIIACSRLHPMKRIDVIIDSVKILIDDGYNICFNIYGEGELYEYLNNKIIRYGLCDKVLLHGFTDNALQKITENDVLIVNSSNSEGLPTVILESWSVKTLVLTNNYDGRIDEFIQDSFTGFVLFENSSIYLANKLKQIYNLDQTQRNQIIENAFNKFNASYTQERYLKEYTNLFRNI